ncbi:hypothetical protein EV127DRAFT_484850 [Xylaria flabelliformis]|nr:hypothetical protein EV127DRAFT_484850 [Xylaria flabelliformis]
MESAGIQFILSTGSKDRFEKPEIRKAIRRHVMLGKNRGKSYPDRRKPTRRRLTLPGTVSKTISMFSTIEMCSLKIPRQVGSDLSSLPWAGGVDVPTIATIMKFSSLTKSETFPIEVFIDQPPKDIRWLEPLLSDAAWVHTMAFSANAYFDVLCHRSTRPNNEWASPHFTETLHILRERMRLGEDIATSNSTLLVVVALATHAILNGEFEVARCHVLGLHRIVYLRGGIDTFRPYHKLLAEILRSDISLSLHTGTVPLFFQDSVPSGAHWRCPQIRFQHITDYSYISTHFALSHDTLGCLDRDLEDILAVLNEFSQQVNRATAVNSRLPKEFLLDTMVFVTYRLLYLRFTSGSLDEVTRIGLLAFCSGTFVQWRQVVPVPSSFLAALIRETLAHLGNPDISPQFALWMLMLGALTVFTDGSKTWLHPWLRTSMMACRVDSWSGVSDVLHSFPWVDILYDGPGRDLFAELSSEAKRLSPVDQ